MIRCDRSTVAFPSTLESRDRDGLTELERVRKFMEERDGLPPDHKDRARSFPFATYKGDAVKQGLEQLFHGKCAYCECFYSSTQPVDVEHYRPKNAVEGEPDHPGYWWIAMGWDNLLPSCIDCNRRRRQPTPDVTRAVSLESLEGSNKDYGWKRILTGKQASFPLAKGSFRARCEEDDLDREERLLLDPTRDDPAAHLLFQVDRANLVSIVYPRPIESDHPDFLPDTELADEAAIEDAALRNGASAKGAVSIQVYGLNRLGLVQARSRYLRDLEFATAMLVGIEEARAELAEWRRTRLAERRAARERRDSAGEQRLDEEISLVNRLLRHFDGQRDLMQGQLRTMLDPSAPFSAVAQAWRDQVLAEYEPS